MKKVIHINAHGIFSTGNIASMIVEKLNNGSLFCHALDELDKPYALKFASNFEKLADVAMTRLTGIDGSWSWNNTRKILAVLKKEKPDIVHLHNLHGYYINYKWLFRFLKKKKIKVVWTLHDCWSFTGDCPYVEYIGCEKWKDGCGNCPNLDNAYFKSWFFDQTRRNHRAKQRAVKGLESLTVVTPSEWLANLAKQSFLGKYQIKVINNGINTEKFYIRPNESFKDIIPTDKKVLIAVASCWDKRKGLDDVIKIAERLSEQFCTVVVGVNAAQMERISSQPGIIAIRRTKDQGELAQLYSCASAFINPTYEENYPTVNMEALCCGCPVITYKTGGSVETVNEKTGIVVPKGDIDAMVEAVLNVCNLKFDREAISTDAKQRHTKEHMINEYIKLYESL